MFTLYTSSGLDSDLPALVSWWRGDMAFLIDVTNDDAVNWYLNNLQSLQTSYNITTFKFDAGEVNWLPNVYSTHKQLSNPDDFSKHFIDMAFR